MQDVAHSPVRLVKAAPVGERLYFHQGRGAVVLSDEQVEITFVPQPPGGWLGTLLMLVLMDPLHSLLDSALGRSDDRMATLLADASTARAAYDARRDRYAVQLESTRWAAFELTRLPPARREEFRRAFETVFANRLAQTDLPEPSRFLRGVGTFIVAILILTMAILLVAFLLAG